MPQPGAGKTTTREKVATVNIKNMGAVDIVYVGGSMFELAFAGKGKKPVRFETPVLDKLIASDQVKLTSPARYEEIKASILPDGSTKTHNADGTLKSSASKTMESLLDDGYIERGADGSMSVNADGKPRTKKTKKVTAQSAPQEPMDLFGDMDASYEDLFSGDFGTSGSVPKPPSQSLQSKPPENQEEHSNDEVPDFSDAAVSGATKSTSSPSPIQQSPGSQQADPGAISSLFSIPADVEVSSNPAFDLFDDPEPPAPEKKPNFTLVYEEKEAELEDIPEDGPGELGEAPTARMRRRKRSEGMSNSVEAGNLAGDLNGDGIVDEIDELVAQERHRNFAVMFTLTVTCLASFLLFFAGRSISAAVIKGEPLSLVPSISLPSPSEGGEGQDAGQGQEGGSDDGQDATGEIVKRDDFDPEKAVSGFPMASEEKESAALLVMQAIRQSILDGDVNQYNEAVELNEIGTQLTIAYAKAAGTEQHLSEAEQHETQDAWWFAFTQEERQHVVDRDTAGSIFGGRIREVRQDPHDPARIYVVMEAIAGDHQRICVGLLESADGGWTVDKVMNPEGYVKMIMAGR